ncbi:MAG: ROK family protein [Beijerinckiaceae bacterium]
MQFEFPVLLADIGGTHCRLAVQEKAGAQPLPLARLASASITDLPHALQAATAGKSVRAAVLAVAGVVESPRMTLTNLPWSIDAAAIGTRLNYDSVLLVNDFEAQAAAITAFQPQDCMTLQAGRANAAGTRLIVGAGTGFGTAFLHPVHDGFSIVASEAGHMDLPLAPDDHEKFATALRTFHPAQDMESILSGPGLSRLHRALHGHIMEPSAIVAAAGADQRQAQETIRVFLRLLANATANLVLAAKTTGGAWIAGGVIGHLLPWLDRNVFLKNFCEKPPLRNLLEQVPLHIVTREGSAFPGLAAIASSPARFGLHQPPGLWRGRHPAQ